MIRHLAAFLALSFAITDACAAHPVSGQASAIRNEGVMVEAGEIKILFDPIYDENFGDYHEITEELATSITRGTAPYDNVDAVFVTHAHGDHFSAEGLLAMLGAQPSLLVYAPSQAVDMMRQSSGWHEAYADRITAIDIAIGDVASYALGDAQVQAFYIPHAGWPDSQRTLQHYIYRVSFERGVRVMHLGDAAHNDDLYAPHQQLFASGRTGLAFIPYWMLLEPEGRALIDNRLNAEHVIAIHVPTEVPQALVDSGEDYFSTLGETRAIPPFVDEH